MTLSMFGSLALREAGGKRGQSYSLNRYPKIIFTSR